MNLFIAEGFDHAMLDGLFPDPTITLYRHATPVPDVRIEPDFL
jgi:hypothetical protein